MADLRVLDGEEPNGGWSWSWSRETLLSALYLLAKRIVDVMLSVPALLVLSPLLAVVAILIKLDSPGPVVFAQERVGYDPRNRTTRTFTMYKFRTMYHGCDQGVHRAYITRVISGGDGVETSRDGEGFVKITHDPRVTRVGRVLRRLVIDELPQLFNVARGDMSLVGPRPAIPYEVALYKPHHMKRLQAIPGCTGLWQANGWCKRDFEDMVKLDVEYIEHQSPWLDIKILYRTVLAILARQGGG